MRIRELQASDLPRVKELYEKSGFRYTLPDFTDGTFIDIEAMVDENDVVRQLVAARKAADIYFIGDPEWETPAWRLEALRKLHESVRKKLVAEGIPTVNAQLPPPIEKQFGSRLKRTFGWAEMFWKTYSRSTRPRRGE